LHSLPSRQASWSESATKNLAQGLISMRRPKLPTSLVLTLLLLVPHVSSQVREVRRVLIINDLNTLSSPGFALTNQAIVEGLQNSPYQIELYSENLETTLFPNEAWQYELRRWLLRKYTDRKPDVIIAVGRASIQFVVESQEKSFPGVPVVFCGSTEVVLKRLKADPHVTGVWAVAQPDKTLEIALRLQPGTKHVVVVGGVGAFDRETEAIVKKNLGSYESKFEFTSLTDLDMPTLLERLKHLPSDTIVFHTSLMEDAAGTHFIDASQSVPLIAAAANAPVFVVDDVDLRDGTVGGDLLSWAATGQVAAGMAVRILNGEKPQDIPIVKSPNIYMFDWRALRRWGFSESALPPASLVLNRQPSVWESYKNYIAAGVTLILLEGLLIFALLWQRQRRRKAEAELEIAFDRLRLAVEAGKSVGWDWDVKNGRDRWFGDLQTMFGIPSDTYEGEVGEFQRRLHPEDSDHVWKAVADARYNHQPYTAEFRVIRDKDRSTRWITARGRFYYGSNGDAVRMLGMAVDITDRMQMEQRARESEERFRLVANTAPVMIWMSGPDKLCTYFNQPWLDFTGRPLESELGNGWAEGVHPDDLEHCLDAYTQAFDDGRSFEMQYRLRRHDGEYRWVFNTGVPRLNLDNSVAGYIGSCLDITERKLAEEALAGMSGKLIQAHEEERARIARELHDDINQQIALVSVQLESWIQQYPESAFPDTTLLRKSRQKLNEIGTDVQALSHRLHSSKLDYLGLAVASSSFCKEFSEQHKVEVLFTQSNVARNIPKETSLSLFRVLQEALQNAVKHSGARQFSVVLCGTSKEIQLTVSDVGLGFNLPDALAHRGLGLISMRERLQLVGGELSIISEPGRGTTISARVPHREEYRPARAAG